MYIDGIVVRLGFHAPYLIHELDAGEDLAGIGQELIQKIEFLAGESLAFIPAAYGQGVVVQAHITDGDAPFVHNLSPAQQCPDAQNHFLLIHRLCHIIVCSNNEPLPFVLRQLLGSDHENGQGVICCPQLSGELVAIHARHHDVQDNQVHMVGI